MKTLRRMAIIAAVLVVQTTLARYLVRGSIGVDLVLVAVVYLSLTAGPVAGVLSGTAAGLAQDALASGIVGIGGLAKTVVGFLAGTVGAAFIVAQPVPRFLVFFGATVVEMLMIAGFHAVLDVVPAGVPVGAVVAQALGNALVGVVAFQVVENVPRVLDRRRDAGRGRRRP